MRKYYSATFKAEAVRELMKEEKTISQLAAELGFHPTQLKEWRKIALTGLPELHPTHPALQHRCGELTARDLRLAQLAFERGAAGEEFVHFSDDAFLFGKEWEENASVC